MHQTLHQIVREAEQNLTTGSVSIGKYVNHSHNEVVERINAYINSKHISGERDSLGRKKPFFNIVPAASNVWYRATDLDRKDLRFIPTKASSVVLAFVANVLLQRWMDKAKFGIFLNQWGLTLAQYGSAIPKFVEKGGELTASVISWNRAIVDPIDYSALPSIEKFYLTESQLKARKEYNQDVVTSLCDALVSRETTDRQRKDNSARFIELYEIHGELPVAHLKKDPKDGDWEKYAQQVHIVSYVQEKDGETKDFTLYSGREAKNPTMITHLKEEDGRTLSIGAVEHLFESQWMVNHAMKNIKDTLDIASRLIFQTADKRYVGRNVLSSIESGDIFIHEDNKPLTRIANDKPDIVANMNFVSAWQGIGNEIASTPDAIKGNTLPSGTPYSLGAFLGTQANSLFEQFTETKGLYLEEMAREYIIPHLKKKLKNKDEVVAILDDAGIEEIDRMYVPRAAIKNFNKRVGGQILQNAEAILNGAVPSPIQPFNAEVEQGAVREQLSQFGNKRFLKPDELGEKSWKEVFSDFEWDNLRVETTNENVDKKAVLQTLASLYTTTVQVDPVAANVILGEILNETGVVSPLRLKATQSRPQPAAAGRDLSKISEAV